MNFGLNVPVTRFTPLVAHLESQGIEFLILNIAAFMADEEVIEPALEFGSQQDCDTARDFLLTIH